MVAWLWLCKWLCKTMNRILDGFFVCNLLELVIASSLYFPDFLSTYLLPSTLFQRNRLPYWPLIFSAMFWVPSLWHILQLLFSHGFWNSILSMRLYFIWRFRPLILKLEHGHSPLDISSHAFLFLCKCYLHFESFDRLLDILIFDIYLISHFFF